MTYFKVKSTVLRGGGFLLQRDNHVLEVGQMPQMTPLLVAIYYIYYYLLLLQRILNNNINGNLILTLF